MATQDEKEYIKIPSAFVKEGLVNKETGKEFNLVECPKGTIVDGKDVGGYQFSPLFVNKPNKFEGKDLVRDDSGNPVQNENSKMREIPVKKDSEIWLKKKGEETVKVSPAVLKASLTEQFKRYREQKKEEPARDEKAAAIEAAAKKNEGQERNAPKQGKAR